MRVAEDEGGVDAWGTVVGDEHCELGEGLAFLDIGQNK